MQHSGSTGSGKRSREGCWTCRKRKKKCDTINRPCGNCSRLGLQCLTSAPVVWEDDPRREGMARRGPQRHSRSSDKSSPGIHTPPRRPTAGQRGSGVCDVVAEKNLASVASSSALSTAQQRHNTPVNLAGISSWPHDLTSVERQLLDCYIGRFSRTYPTFSGPANPFLSVFLPLAMQSRTVLNSVLALGGVQTWRNGTFTMESSMFRLRQKSLRGCWSLVAGVSAANNDDDASRTSTAITGPAALRTAVQTFLDNNTAQSKQAESSLYVIASCVLLLLYEKLAGEGQENGTSHLSFFAHLLPDELLFRTLAHACAMEGGDHSLTEAFQFICNLFLYNDFVLSTSRRTSPLSAFYLLETASLADADRADGDVSHAQLVRYADRFVFPRLISRITLGDATVSDADIDTWDGSLAWLPSYALAPEKGMFPKEQDHIMVSHHEFVMDPAWVRLESFCQPGGWTELRVVSDLYRIAAAVYRKQAALKRALDGTTMQRDSIVDLDGFWTGNLPLWATQLIEYIDEQSLFATSILWPIGIIAKELTCSWSEEREIIAFKLETLEKKLEMRHFRRTRTRLAEMWSRMDRGDNHDSQEVVFFG